MSKARPDLLRIFDSRGIAAYAPIKLEHRMYEIGSDTRYLDSAEGFIVVPGSGVAPVHARLRQPQNSTTWTIMPLGDAVIRIGEDVIPTGSEHAIDNERDIWIGNAHLQLVYVNPDERVKAGVGKLSDLEQLLSLQLLEFEERSRSLFKSVDQNERQVLLSNELDRLIAVELEQLSAESLFLYCQEALRRLLVARCLKSGTPGDVVRVFSRMNKDQERRSRDIRQAYIGELALDITPENTAADIQKVEEGLPQVHQTLGRNIEEYMRRLLVGDAARDTILNLIFRLGPIQFLLETPGINEIMVNGHSKVFIEKMGQMFDTRLPFTSERELLRIAHAIASSDNKNLTQVQTMVDARLPDGSRANIVLNPTSRQGTAITIRKFSKDPYSLDFLRSKGTLNAEMQVFLEACVKARKNIVISGGTGTGKTTLLNAMSQVIPESERVVTIEDTAELSLKIANIVSMEGRPPNAEGEGEISIQGMLRNALRMRPDRIIVGECRGGETLDMLQAMNTGHDGSMTTAHANSPEDLLLRLETMVAQSKTAMPVFAIRQQIAAAVDVIVQVERLSENVPGLGTKFTRKITHISELGRYDSDTGDIPISPIFSYVGAQENRAARFNVSGHIPDFFDDLVQRDFIDIDRLFHSNLEPSG